MDEIDRLEDEVASLEQTLGDAAAMTASFGGQLDRMKTTLGETGAGLGNLERGFAGGLRKAFDGLAFDGLKLSDALGVVAQSMIDTAYSAAIRPVSNQLGGVLADGVNGIVAGMMPFEKGGAFSSGRVMPFAKGGVISGATTFPMRSGTGLMGEAGPEAIMPLTRGPDGSLGVRTSGGGAPHVTMHITTPDVQGFQRSQGQIAARLSRALGAGHRNA